MTNDNSTGIGTPKSYWFVAILFLAWNLVGIFNYLSSVKATPESLAVQGMTAEQIEFMLGVPAHYMAVFARGCHNIYKNTDLVLVDFCFGLGVERAWGGGLFN